MTRPLIALLAATALAGCAVGPNYEPPQTASSAAAPFLNAAVPGVATTAPDDHWWHLYDDPVLDHLVSDALAANTDIRVAVARLEKARAQLRGARADELPQTGLDASFSREHAAISQVLPGQPRTFSEVDGGISVNYEVDLFGRVRREVEAARADSAAAAEDADAVRVAVVADTVRAYVDAAASAQRIAVAQHTVDLLDQGLRITQARFDAGRTDRLEMIRIAALRDQQAAAVPALTADRDAALLRLATLTGRAPRDLPEAAKARLTPPDLTQPIPIGDGRTLLARRPDVRAAERRLAADTARIGVATADLYPRITLGGSTGITSIGTSDIFGGGPFRWLVGPMISWAFPNQEAIRARIGGARADAHADLATFDGTVLKALQETETALSAYRGAALRRQTLSQARDEAARAARITLARQREGQIDSLTLLDAQRTLAGAESDLAEANRAVAFAQVDLFKALGGGWQEQSKTS
jgi:NodT family efflux transporter outer membrane factor (OMF) lipoprotein